MKLVLILLLLILPGIISAQRFYLNPGIKLGYSFGKEGGFVFGFEVSATYFNEKESTFWGVVFDYDKISTLNRIHIGIEGSKSVFGLDLGPTFAWDENNKYTGFSIIPYTGLFAYPYYNFTWLGGKGVFHEVGSYLKIGIGNTNIKFQ